MRSIALFALALTLTGCTVYHSTYWRNEATGAIVECEASWRFFDRALEMQDYCARLMQRAGLVPIGRDAGKQWEQGQGDPPTAADCPGNTFWNGQGCTSR
jgi:hypothetical protein